MQDLPRQGRPTLCPPLLAVLPLIIALVLSQGCQLVGVVAERYKQTSTHEVKAEYTGIKGKTFAVVVSADRSVQASHPGLVDILITRITAMLREHAAARGVVPAPQVLRYMYDHPSWPTHSMSQLASDLGGVERLIFIDLSEFRLYDVGNRYEWDGVAAGTVSVVEADSVTPDSFAFERNISVSFPDKKGTGPQDFDDRMMRSSLVQRFSDRAAWLFYDHQEPYYPKY